MDETTPESNVMCGNGGLWLVGCKAIYARNADENRWGMDDVVEKG